MGVQACRLPAFERLKRLRSFVAQPTPQAKATPRPDQCLIMGVQACRLPGVKRLKRLKSLKPLKCLTILLARSNPAGNRHPKARSMASFGR